NPTRFKFSNLERFATELKKTGSIVFSWSLGQRERVSIGDRVFLLRHTEESEGIVGSGKIAGEAATAPHWNEELKKDGKAYNLVSVQWDALSEKPILPMDELIKATKEEKLWKRQVGGTLIPLDTAELLEIAWKEALDRQETFSPLVGHDIARVESDRVSADAKDHLNVEREAHAFARVAASSNTIPPLSVGVFGEWGSGKTFFMEKMYAHVERLEKTANEAKKIENTTVYHSNIVQIRFNAWHYMEANLWASLVDHIFRELDNWLRPRKEVEKIEALFERLSTTRMLKLEAVKNLVESRRREKEAKTNLEMTRNKLAEMESNRESITRIQFWDAVKDTFGDSDQKLLSEENKKKIAEAAEALGFKDAKDSARELMDALNNAREQGQRGHLILRSLVSRLGSFKWVAVLVTLLILVPVFLPALMELLEKTKVLEFFKPLFEQLSSTAIALSSAAATVASWIGAASVFAVKALNQLNEFKSHLDKKLNERKDKTPEPTLEAERLLAIQRKEVRNAEDGFERAAVLLNQARFKFGASARSRLDQFIRDKITNGDYAKHLGIIATIRKDFEQLARIMSDVETEQGKSSAEEIQNESEEIKYKSEIKALLESEFLNDDEKEAIKEEGKPSDEELNFFQRIVLYIDDLDRCPPEKVVEVLQACHLLLCFPLFIVVVAVDARWISRSLLAQYEKLLEED
ncbi:MAG: P-loop NTPase fold protein, partial [Candidatus Aminicenantaceae bacterium]